MSNEMRLALNIVEANKATEAATLAADPGPQHSTPPSTGHAHPPASTARHRLFLVQPNLASPNLFPRNLVTPETASHGIYDAAWYPARTARPLIQRFGRAQRILFELPRTKLH